MRWEATTTEQAVLAVMAITEKWDILDQVQRRISRPERLYEQRKRTDRLRRHHCTILEGVRRVAAHTLHVFGIGKLRTRDTRSQDLHPRSCTVVERTSADRSYGKPCLEDPTFRLYVHRRELRHRQCETSTPASGLTTPVRYVMTTCEKP